MRKRLFFAIAVLAVLLAVGFSEKVLAGIDTVQTFPTSFPTVKSTNSK